MIWIYILIYLLGAIGTGLLVYISLIKKYIKGKTALRFNIWIEGLDFYYFYFSIVFWFIILPIDIIAYLINKIIERIHKHYNID